MSSILLMRMPAELAGGAVPKWGVGLFVGSGRRSRTTAKMATSTAVVVAAHEQMAVYEAEALLLVEAEVLAMRMH